MAAVSICQLLLLLLAGWCLFGVALCGDLPPLKPGDHSDIRGQVCFRSALEIHKDLDESSFLERIKDFPKKPATVPIDSPCNGMAATCCDSHKERELMRIVSLDYNTKLQTAFDRRTSSCKTAGRKFERALYTNLHKSLELLQMELSGILHANVSQELFEELFDYLYKFVYVQDFCPLRDRTSNQIKKLFRKVFQLKRLQDPMIPEPPEMCLRQLEEYYVSVWHNGTLQNLMQSLNNIRLVAESFELIKSLANSVRRHRWDPSCLSALFTIRHCAYCTGYDNFSPCDGTCLNALRGCTADMAELVPAAVKHVLNMLRKIAKLANSELHPVKILQLALIDYVQLVHHLSLTNFTEIIYSNDCSIDTDTAQRMLQQLQGMRSLQYIASGGISNGLLPAIEDDLKCFKDLGSLLLQLPEEICGIDPNHLAYIRTQECWNGTARGSYNHSIAGHYRADQLTNPAYVNNPLPANASFQWQLTNVHQLTRCINQTLNLYQCLSSDDEDCSTRFVLQCDSTSTVAPPSIELGSGSGSGSGMDAADEGARDMEKSRESPFVIVLGGKRRFGDTENEEDINDITTDTLPSSTLRPHPSPITSSMTAPPSKTTESIYSSATQTTPLSEETPPILSLPRGSASFHCATVLVVLIIALITALLL